MRAAIVKSVLSSSVALGIVLLTAAPAVAQDSGSLSDYRLPDPKQTPTPRVQGPVDPDNPLPAASGTPRPDRTPVTAPAPRAAPRISIPAPTSTQPSERTATRARPSATPSPPAEATSAATPAPSPSPTPTPTQAPAPITPLAPATTEAVAEPSAAPDIASAPASSSNDWLIPGLLGAAVIAGGALLFLRRRRDDDAETSDFGDAPAAPDESPPEPRSTRAEPAPAPAAAPTLPQSASLPSAIGLAEALPLVTAFSPQAVRLSLVYATLQYELDLANSGTVALSPLQIRADLTSAHASLGTREQLAPAPEQLEPKHTTPPLAPGESTVLKGEVRVPLQQVRPLVKGSAQFFVPLVRFCLIAADGSGVRRVFTVGPRDLGSGTLASVRLDAGPRNLRDLDAREIEAARGFALDPVTVAG